MIRFTLSYLKPIGLIISIMLLLECCKAYYKEPVSIDEAINTDTKRIKIISNDNIKNIYKSIYYKNDSLYGLKKGNKTNESVIQIANIKEIHLQNIKKSRVRTALLVILIPVGIVLIFQLAPQ